MKRVNSDLAYVYIRDKIISGHYPAGGSLMAEVIAGEIGISRTPVRDALRKLENDGLVTIKAHIGAQVKFMNMKNFKEVCDLRLALESHAAGLAATYRNDEDLVEMRLALEMMVKLSEQISTSATEAGLIEDLVREDVRFHVAVIKASRNELLKEEIGRLHLINRVVLGPICLEGVDTKKLNKVGRDAHRQKVIRDHGIILENIYKKRVLDAKLTMERHIQDIVDNRIDALVAARQMLELAPSDNIKESAYM